MASPGSSDYLIYSPEKLGLIELVRLFIFRKNLVDCEFVESSKGAKLELENARATRTIVLTLIFQKFLLLFRTLLRLIGSLKIPKRGTKEFRSVIGHIDGRVDLNNKPSSLLGATHFPQMKPLLVLNPFDPDKISKNTLDLTVMAAKIAYENEAYIENVVTNHWKMRFVGFFNCWNKFLSEKATQAFICMDGEQNAERIVVAFRGTEPFEANDWATDIDLSWLSMGPMGRAHLGFMKALGLQNQKDYLNGWPKELARQDKDKPVAYYAVRDALKSLLREHRGAQVLITGHSLGGALAAVFASILSLHEERTILDRLLGVVTYGQPRVGDAAFAGYMDGTTATNANAAAAVGKKFLRTVYRYDIVPRVPFDDRLFQYKHFGDSLYYRSWYRGEARTEEQEVPNKNYFDPRYVLSKFANAWLDLFRGPFIGWSRGRDFREGWVSIGFRLLGLLIPGLASHSPRDYVNAVRLGKITSREMDMV
ncbi:hypothetical protein H6P81_013982 [Aristolochia fimbriata]|uniref:Fungal lipase-type domain-containing protein n=1 Tax=Aristolochia fimbriata TaxID=158543 RepID=A0AAV7EGP1_ARIFI|nr:hypothetical protein H6P81_013982 [Aristolochia fimbriata]